MKNNIRKLAKKREQRRDWVRRRNINANVPSEAREVEEEVYSSETRKDGTVTKKHIGYKTVVKKYKVHKNHRGMPALAQHDDWGRNVGMIRYPASTKRPLA